MLASLSTLAVMALGAAALATTITKSSIFANVRRRWPAKPLTCSYCALHWSAAFIVAASWPAWLGDISQVVAAALVNWLAVIGLGAVINGVILFLTPFASAEDEDE